jgi:hypothetical protein
MTQRSSRLVRSLALLVALGGACLPAGEAVAQRRGSGGISSDILRSSSPLTATQQKEVSDFTRAQIADLANGDVERVVAARDALIQAARGSQVTGVFLRSYSEAILPAITPILDGDDAMRAENALRVAAFLRTPESTGLLVESIDPRRNPDAGRRLVAAGLLGIAVEPAPQSGLGSAVLVSTARGIAEALTTETDWLVALEELRAINAIALSPTLTKANRGQVRTMQFDAFADLAARIARSNEPDPMAQAVYRAMLDLRDKLLDNSVAQDVSSTTIAETLRGTLVAVGSGAVRQWDGLDADPEMMAAYEGTLRVGPQLFLLLQRPEDQNINTMAAVMTQALEAPAGSKARTDARNALKKAVDAAG